MVGARGVHARRRYGRRLSCRHKPGGSRTVGVEAAAAGAARCSRARRAPRRRRARSRAPGRCRAVGARAAAARTAGRAARRPPRRRRRPRSPRVSSTSSPCSRTRSRRRAAGAPVADRVLDQVADEALEQHLVAADRRRPSLQLELHARRGGLARDGGGARGATAARSTGSSRRAALGCGPAASAAVEQQLRAVGRLDARRAPSRSSATSASGSSSATSASVRMTVSGRAQLVGGVGDEAALRLDRRPRRGRASRRTRRPARAARPAGPSSATRASSRSSEIRRAVAAIVRIGGRSAPGRQPADAERHQRRPGHRDRVLHAELARARRRRTRAAACAQVVGEQPPARPSRQPSPRRAERPKGP